MNKLFLFFLALVITACSSQPAPPVVPTLARDGLMRLAFPEWAPDLKHTSRLEVSEVSEKATQDGVYIGDFFLEPEQVVRLSENLAVLIATGPEYEEGRGKAVEPLDPGILTAVWFKRKDGWWTVDHRQQQVEHAGSFGSVGDISITKLDGTRFGLGNVSGGCWQGSCTRSLMLYAISKDSIQPILKEAIPLEANNEGAMGGSWCGDIFKHSDGVVFDTKQEPITDCFNVSGKWRVLPAKTNLGDLVINFTEHRASIADDSDISATQSGVVDANEPLKVVLTNKKSQAVYRFDGKQYKLISGENPVPSV